jgi:hypothetical protein
MYNNRKKNTTILLGSLIFYWCRFIYWFKTTVVGDVLWLRYDSSHHSIAILTSERADIKIQVKKAITIL